MATEDVPPYPNPWTQRAKMRVLLWLTLVGVVTLVASPLAAEAQEGKIARLAILAVAATAESPSHVAFLERLRDLGWHEGRNLTVDLRSAAGQRERLPALVSELLRLAPDVIYAKDFVAVEATKGATSAVPVVFYILSDPVAAGFISSLVRPGGNLTGVSGFEFEHHGKRLELLKEAMPWLARIAVLSDMSFSSAPRHVQEVQSAARALRVKVDVIEIRRLQEVDGALAAAAAKHPEALYVLASPMLHNNRQRVLPLVDKRRLPAMWSESTWVPDGGLIAYTPDHLEMHRRAAHYVDRILRGARPSDLPVERPTRFVLQINSRTAKKLGLTIPHSLLQRADQVIN
jgi:putative ABC transport system substrate-binding protein